MLKTAIKQYPKVKPTAEVCLQLDNAAKITLTKMQSNYYGLNEAVLTAGILFAMTSRRCSPIDFHFLTKQHLLTISISKSTKKKLHQCLLYNLQYIIFIKILSYLLRQTTIFVKLKYNEIVII